MTKYLIPLFFVILMGLICLGCSSMNGFNNPFADIQLPTPVPSSIGITPVPTPTFAGGHELALNQPAYSSTSMRYNPAGSANDDDVLTGWAASGPTIPSSWWVKFNGLYNLTGIQFTLAATDLQVAYKIYTSSNGSSWNMILDKSSLTGPSPRPEATQFEIIQGQPQARYVKMEFTNILSPNWPMLYDVKVYGKQPTPAPTPVITPVRTPLTNLVINPGFELDSGIVQNISGWQTNCTDPVADYTETAFHLGAYNLKQMGSDSKKTYSITTYQDITGLPNGLYTFRAWAYSTASVHYLIVSGYGGTDITADITNNSAYQQFSIPNINVTSGHCVIGFFTQHSATGGSYFTHVDDVEFFLQ